MIFKKFECFLFIYFVARQVWHDIRSPSLRAGTLSVLSDESFMSAMEDWVIFTPEF